MQLSTAEILAAVNGRPARGNESTQWSSVSTDSRAALPGALFFALSGETFDGHDFIEQAVRGGAMGVVAAYGRLSRDRMNGLPPEVAVVEVDDTLRALGDAAAAWRRKVNPLVMAVTGSGGKTTTKEMIFSIVSLAHTTLKNEGNFNNLIGLPLTLFRLEAVHRTAVLEMGMNMPGEIGRLCEIAQPNIGIITNIRSAHVGKLGSMENVARAKCEMLPALANGGTFVRNLDDEWVVRGSEGRKGRTVTYGTSRGADVRLESWRERGGEGGIVRMALPDGSVDVEMHAYGAHNVMNALAAAAVSSALLIDADIIKRGLERFRPVDKRMKLYRLAGNVRLMDDSYNANPEAMALAIDTVAGMRGADKGRFIAVLGDMGELGEFAAEAHAALGRKTADAGVDEVFYLGSMSDRFARGAEERGTAPGRIHAFGDHTSLSDALVADIRENDWILVKASRAVGLERVAEAIRKSRER